MKLEEFCSRYQINKERLARLEKEGFFDFVETMESKKDFQEKHINQIGFILNLENIGLSMEDIKRYLQLLEDKEKNRESLVAILKKQRCKVLNTVHAQQQLLYDIDYMVYDITNTKKK